HVSFCAVSSTLSLHDALPIFSHLARPDPAGRAVFGQLLEEIVVRVEEEGETGRELVDLQAAVDPPADVLHAVRQGEGELLRRRRDRKSTRLNSSHQIISYAVF